MAQSPLLMAPSPKANAASGEKEGDAVPAPAPTVLKGRERTVVEEYRERITKIYTEKQPTKLDEIEKFLEKYKGQEHILYLKVCKKYSVVEEEEYRGNSPFGRGLFVLTKKPTGTLAENKTSDDGNLATTSPSSAATPPAQVPAKAGSLDGNSLGKLLFSGTPSFSLPQGSGPLVSGTLAAPTPLTDNGRPKPPAAEAPPAKDDVPARNRSRSPRSTQAKPMTSPVWAVTLKHILGAIVQARTVAVCSSKELATAAALREMQARKAEGGSDQKLEDLPGCSLASSEDPACGFKVLTESKNESYEWRLSSHVLE